MSFSEIPTLDLALARSPTTKPAFLSSLRHAILEVGFLYIRNTGIPPSLITNVIQNAHAFFALPPAKKLEVQMVRQKSFLGYNILGGETTAHQTDWREQLDLSTSHAIPSADKPPYYNLLAPNQWPDSTSLPDFRPVYEDYIARMGELSRSFTSLIAEALDMEPTAFDRFFDAEQQHKLKIVRYPDAAELGLKTGQKGQGVGPHKDSMLSSYLLQASGHKGLQAQNVRGEWIDCPPVEGTLVVALGQGLEALTEGVCASTTHRVLSPEAGLGARLSVPFFQGVSYDATFESVAVPDHVREEKRKIVERDGGVRVDDVEFTFVKGRWGHLGEATLYNRAKSHPDVAMRWYPELWERICRDREVELGGKRTEGEERAEGKGMLGGEAEGGGKRAVEAH